MHNTHCVKNKKFKENVTMTKTSKKIGIALLTIVMSFVCAITLIAVPNRAFAAYAEDATTISWQDECAEFTSHEKFNINGTEHTITDYSNYINEHFKIGQKCESDDIYDEWLFSIVPQSLFDNPGQYSYLGQHYGFLLDYNADRNVYFLYLYSVKNTDIDSDNSNVGGHYETKITPIYYENYRYNKENGKAQLERNVDDNEYRRLSDLRKIYLHNVSFGASVYNEHHLNFGDEEYVASEDDGAFFIGTYYGYKGVSAMMAPDKFIKYTAEQLIGLIPYADKVMGVISDVKSFAEAAINYADGINGITEELTNEDDFGYSIEDISKLDQLAKYDNLLKDMVNILETPKDEPILFGIQDGCYITSKYFINKTQNWDFRLTQQMQFDIVEDTGSLISGVKTLYDDIKTNTFSNTYNDDEVMTLSDEEQAEVYLLPNGQARFEFVAPESGEYTFETYGNIKNQVYLATADNIIIARGTLKDDGINQCVKATLKKGQVYKIYTNAAEVYPNIVRYKLGVTFTPCEMKPGETKTFVVKAGETEFISILNTRPSAYDYNIAYNGELDITVMEGSRNNAIIHTYKSMNPSGSFVAKYSDRYYIKIQNNNAVDATITVSINDVETLSYGKQQSIDCVTNKIYKISPEYTSAYSFDISGKYSVTARILDSNLDELTLYSDNKVNLSQSLSANATYYVEIKPSAAMTVDVLCRPQPQALSFGINNLTKNSTNILHSFISVDTDVVVNIESNANIVVFDEYMDRMTLPLFVEQGKRYYVGVSGSNTYTVSVSPQISPMSGKFDNTGFAFLQFTPNRTGSYKVVGNDSVQWYNTKLQRINNTLTAGQVYYLKLNGASGSNYSVKVLLDAPSLSFNVNQTVSAGVYAIDIDSNDKYAFRTYSANSVSAVIKIYDENNSVISTFNADADAKIMSLSQGRYLLEISISGGTRTAIKIMPQKQIEFDNINIYDNGASVNVRLTNEKGVVLKYDCKNTKTYYLTFASTNQTKYDVSVFDSSFNKVDVDIENVNTSDMQVLKTKYAVAMKAGVTYYIAVDCVNQESVDTSILLVVPTKIEYIDVGNQRVYNKGTVSDKVNILMNSESSISITYNDDATIKNSVMRISDTQNANNVASISNGKLKIAYNASAEDKIVVLWFEDDYGAYSVTLTVKFPYYATAELSDYSYKLTTRSGLDNSAVSTDTFVSMSFELNGTTYTWTTKTCDTIKLPIFESTNISKMKAVYKCGNNQYTVNVKTLAGSTTIPYNVQRYNGIGSYNYENAKSYSRIVIDLSSNSSCQSITIPSQVRAAFILNDGDQLTNLSVLYDGTNVGYLYLDNVNIKSVSSNYALKSNRSTLTLEVKNTVTIKGQLTSSYYLIDCKNLDIIGNGNLTVEGNVGTASIMTGTNAVRASTISIGNSGRTSFVGGAGANGAATTSYGQNGNNGGAGGNALNCSSLVKKGNGTYTLTAGKGGNGSNGYQGAPGANGVSRWSGYNFIFEYPTVGGKGGNGGNGGASGYTCNAAIPSGITAYAANYGNGGNGGDGGAGGNGSPKSLAPTGTSTSPGHHAAAGGNGGNGGSGYIGGNGGAGGKGGTIPGGDQDYNGGAGGNGGNGGDGISVLTTSRGGNGGRGGDGGFTHAPGKSGAGGNGGNGGNCLNGTGGMGGNGGNGHNDTSNNGKPSAGGNGGNGGIGGLNSDGTRARHGDGGNGGNGGDPGSLGHGLNGGRGGDGYNGGKGGNGSSSHIIFAHGGNGGKGGNAYGGTVGTGGSGGSGTWASNGSKGANGTSYSSGSYNG